jgi:diguanylate cyclase (GGDEF)-like protein
LAYSDPLTDLPNRLQFTERVSAAIDELRRERAICAVLMLDLDRFKHINDVHGHAFGDRLLVRVAQRLSGECLEAGDFLARLGGDEFAILSSGLDAAATIAKGRRIANALDLPFALDDRTVDLAGSIGVALFPDDGATVHELLARAEIAMYAAKRRRTGILRYDRADDISDEGSLSLRGELRQALACDELRLYLQPKARVADGRIVGAEALIRWQHPQRGLVPPIQFIPFAEQIGFIRHLTAWVIEHAVKWLASVELPQQDFTLSLNLSARDLLEADLAARVAEALARHGVPAERLCLEITESAVMEDFERALTTLQNLHRLGVRLSLDDYGTGYSSLAYMSRLPIAELKIDKSFVLTMESDVRHADIVRSTIDLGHNLGLSVVAEGVETATAWQMLAGWGCDAIQGYFLGKPVPVEQFDLEAEALALSGSRAPLSPTAPAGASATA